jgi:hypothetical protein
LNDSTISSLVEWNTIDNENNAPEEVSLTYNQQDEPESFEALLITEPEESKIAITMCYLNEQFFFTFEIETIDACLLHEFDWSTNSSQPQAHVNQTTSFPSNDEITRHICQPYTPFRSDINELHIMENADHAVEVVVQTVVDIVVKQSASVSELCYERNSDDLTPHLRDQIVQETSSVKLSSSLQFVHDVHPYQKTQHDTNNSDGCIEKNLSPYVMRIQGIKTNTDKGKSILPRIKVSVKVP